jgi:hypothetical protein
MDFSVFRRATALLFGLSAITAWGATSANLDQQFNQNVRPFVLKYCAGCHSGETPAASFDLKSYASMDAVIRDYPRWALVHDKLAAKQMPPKPMPAPPAEATAKVLDWLQAVRAEEIRKHAGDPGPVLARRLSNSEYNYTIRDLTGVDMQPTREFPVDPANPAGFDNSGESLTLSPALLKKYLQAAHDIGDHMVLTPDGIDFAPYPMLSETDREKYPIQRIVNFYASQPTDFADYFQAAWRYKNRIALKKPNATLASIAAESKVSPKYLPLVWQLIEEPSEKAKKEVGPIAKLQAMWRALPSPSANQPDVLREKCAAMRDFVIGIRAHTSMQFSAPVVHGLPAGSQPLLNWKLRAFAAHRRDSDIFALRLLDGPPALWPVIPNYADLHGEAADRWAALMANHRAGDPDLVVPSGELRRYEDSFARFASVFPDAFYISERGRYFPDDSEDRGRLLSAGYHNSMGFFRDDTPLMELILDEKGQKHLNRLWDEFDYIGAYTARTWVQFFFNQSGAVDGKGAESGTPRPADHEVTDEAVIMQMRDKYLAKALADPSNDPTAPEAVREHFKRVNDTLRSLERMHKDAEPHHLDALLAFTARAYRRPLTKIERDDMIAYYHRMREKDGLSHEDAIRDSIVSVLMSPYFLYCIDSAEGKVPVTTGAVRPLSNYELARRLSYFLWSSTPDAELMHHAAVGDLERPEVLLAQTRRMLKDEKVRDFATEFAGNWLDFRRFENYNSVDRQRFPTFTNDLREAMFQEPIRFIEDVIRNNRPVLDMLYGNYTFVNPVLAKHYGMPDVKGDADTWVRVDDASRFERGGLLPMAVFLTNTSPGLRTSPVKRGYWVVHRVLGETIPPPPPVVPELPSDESKADKPLREALAQHRANPVCAGCHARFDVFGLAFEGYGPTGEARTKDLGGRPIDASATFPGGVEGTGFAGVQAFIKEYRQNDFVDGLTRKLLAYALDRSPQLSDETLIERMKANLAAKNGRFDALVETIVTSPQFLNKREPHPDIQLRKGE